MKKKYLILLLVAFILIVFAFFAPSFLTRYCSEYENCGQIGDTIGGLMNPFLSIAAIIVSFIAFYTQYEANLNQKEQFMFDTYFKYLTYQKETFDSFLNKSGDFLLFYSFQTTTFYDYIKTIIEFHNNIIKVNKGFEILRIRRSIYQSIFDKNKGLFFIDFLFEFLNFSNDKILKNKESYFFKSFIITNFDLKTIKLFIEILIEINSISEYFSSKNSLKLVSIKNNIEKLINEE
jgi:hypothetical protein